MFYNHCILFYYIAIYLIIMLKNIFCICFYGNFINFYLFYL
jgi:hypothetical protein